ncbi:MAG: glycosyltransferase family 4 protein [Gemmatimonadaceae bacterium]|nr:glycosyltransferase family 4 protein [Acetobacteraceae bacterium]
MHVLIANNIYPPIQAGGAELIVAYLAEGLVRRGHRVTVVSTCGPEMEPYPAEIRQGVEVIRFFPRNVYWSFSRSRQPGLRKAVWHARDAWNRDAGRRFKAVLDRGRPDVVNTHLIDGMSAAIWARARQDRVPVLHTAHDYHLLCPRAFLMTRDWAVCTTPQLACRTYRGWHLRTTRQIDTFASPSQFLLDRHAQAGLAVPRRIVLHNGIPQPDTIDAVRRARTPDARRRFLMLARLTQEKGVQVVLDAVARLPPGLDIEVAIAGTGPLEDVVRAAAASDRRIVPLGYITGEEKQAALTRAGHLLLPSQWLENAPVVIVEAAAYGLGIVASRIGGIPEFVAHGHTGLLVPPGDAAALAASMVHLACDDGALPDLSSASHAMAQRFTVDRMLDGYEAEFHRLTAQPAARAA